ncbi:unnamed protein product [Dibothriocephalus latus]|uniref:IBR domain-containing protein n=1 Tax=Dibothriocephalus latus TaxID=60516 RepID=A0A3P7LUN4_DIBLA|nr:unnamed protein product [Dibothriocephalus latus]
MPDMVPCPNADCKNEHVLLNEDRVQGVCPTCRFHFCARCKAAYHEGKPCQTGDLTNLTPEEVAEVVARYDEAGVDGRAQMELQFGKDNLNQLIAEYKANEVIRKDCKPYPKCKN